MDEESISVLHGETEWSRKGVAEAIWIKCKAPSLNSGHERHIFLATYMDLLPQRSPLAWSFDLRELV